MPTNKHGIDELKLVDIYTIADSDNCYTNPMNVIVVFIFGEEADLIKLKRAEGLFLIRCPLALYIRIAYYFCITKLMYIQGRHSDLKFECNGVDFILSKMLEFPF